MNKTKRIIAQIILVVIVVLAGFGVMRTLMSLKQAPDRNPPRIEPPLLNAIEVSSEPVRMTISGYGSVQPRSLVQVVPQVSGRVIKCHDEWVDGGFFKAGEPLIEIETVDYELAVQNAEAMVAQAEVALQQEQAEANTARTEWEQMHPGQAPPSALVLREPQIKNAEAQLKAAQAQLKDAELNLQRTTVSMPFNGRIVSTDIDAGQYVTSAAPVATVYRTDLVEITVPLENEELAWFQVPLSMNDGSNPDAYNSSPAQVTADFAGKQYTWQGRVVRTEGEIDARSRLVPVVVQVDDPFAVTNGEVPLTPGMFVTVEIKGKRVDEITRVPRYAIHNRTNVWVAREMPDEEGPADIAIDTSSDEMPDASSANDQDTSDAEPEPQTQDYKELNILTVRIIRMDKEYAYISEGLADGDWVITSPLETVTNKMKVRINQQMTEPMPREQTQETPL